MRATNRWLQAVILSAGISLPGCLEKYEVTTTVAADGSCERIVTLRRDSQQLPAKAFPVPVDSPWVCSWSQAPREPARGDTGGKGTAYVYTARRRFADFDELSREYPGSRDSADLSLRVRIEKKFRWFYTYYVYEETYGRFNPLRDTLQPTAYMTQEEIQRFMGSEKPDSLVRSKWMQWTERKKDEWMFARLVDLVARRNDPALPASLFEQNKERLIRALSEKDTAARGNGAVTEPRKGHTAGRKTGSGSEEAVEILARELGTEAVRGLTSGLDSLIGEFLRRDSLASRANGEYTNSVVMPGALVETNAQEVRGTSAVWRFTHEHLALADYSMTAESRVANIWAMVISGIVVLVVILLPVLRKVFVRFSPESASRL